MSADNGIYLMKFQDGIRLTEAQAIENISYCPYGSEEWKEVIRQYFGGSQVFPDYNSAMSEAHRLNSVDPTEYGVVSLGECTEEVFK